KSATEPLESRLGIRGAPHSCYVLTVLLNREIQSALTTDRIVDRSRIGSRNVGNLRGTKPRARNRMTPGRVAIGRENRVIIVLRARRSARTENQYGGAQQHQSKSRSAFPRHLISPRLSAGLGSDA